MNSVSSNSNKNRDSIKPCIHGSCLNPVWLEDGHQEVGARQSRSEPHSQNGFSQLFWQRNMTKTTGLIESWSLFPGCTNVGQSPKVCDILPGRWWLDPKPKPKNKVQAVGPFPFWGAGFIFRLRLRAQSPSGFPDPGECQAECRTPLQSPGDSPNLSTMTRCNTVNCRRSNLSFSINAARQHSRSTLAPKICVKLFLLTTLFFLDSLPLLLK